MTSAVHTADSAAMFWGAVTFLFVAIAVLIVGRYTDILRDSEPVDFGDAKPPGGGTYRRPYSLAQTQMAWWFCIITTSFVIIWLTKHDATGILNPASLVLLGIGTATALGAAAIEQAKSPKFETLNEFKSTLVAISNCKTGSPDAALISRRDELAKSLASENFLQDILSDADGVSLHRFQSAAWTIVLGVIFVVEVLTHLTMPQFDTLTLTILGISGGTYLGFKIPERPA